MQRLDVLKKIKHHDIEGKPRHDVYVFATYINILKLGPLDLCCAFSMRSPFAYSFLSISVIFSFHIRQFITTPLTIHCFLHYRNRMGYYCFYTRFLQKIKGSNGEVSLWKFHFQSCLSECVCRLVKGGGNSPLGIKNLIYRMQVYEY